MITKLIKYLKNHETWAIPLILTVILFVPVLIWLRQDSYLPHWDMGRHLYNSLQYGRLWNGFLAGNESVLQLMTAYFYYPPFLYQISIMFYLFFGTTAHVAVASNIFWLFIFIFGLYNSASLLWSKKTALLSVLLVSAMPMFIGQMREFQLDLPLTAWVMLTFYLFLRYKQKNEFRVAFWLGVTLGLGMLLKWTYFFYALPLLILYVTLTLIEAKKWKKAALSYAISIILAAVICAAWYLSNRAVLRVDLLGNGIDAGIKESDPTGFTWASMTYYFAVIKSQFLLLPLSLAAIIAIIINVAKKSQIRKNWPIIALFFVFYLLFSILPNKDARYIMPAIPFLAILMASTTELVKRKSWRYVSFGIIILLLIINNLTSVFGWGNSRSVALGSWPLTAGGAYTTSAPKSEVCPMAKIISTIPIGSRARLVGHNPIEFNNWALAFYLEKSGRVWAGEGEDTANSDYWIVRLDKTPESKTPLFEYQEKGYVVSNINCSDKSLVVILKNQAYDLDLKY